MVKKSRFYHLPTGDKSDLSWNLPGNRCDPQDPYPHAFEAAIEFARSGEFSNLISSIGDRFSIGRWLSRFGS